MRRAIVIVPALLIVAASTVLAADVTGTWKWSIERNGQTRETTLKLKQEGTKLTGTISGRNNTETPIEEGKVEGEEVSFKVTREFNGNTIVLQYKGKVSGDTIKGQVESERDGQTRTRDWEAKKG
jgi:hypothetical protein